MKTLFPAQETSKSKLITALNEYGSALDASLTGVGKTVVAAHTSKVFYDKKTPVCVICPKIVIPHWERELAEVGIKPLFVTNYEKIKRGNSKYLNKIGKKLYRWVLPERTLIIWDEIHKCAGPFSQNSQMLIASVQAGHMNLMLSATACKDPTEMRSIGYALGLHGLNRDEKDRMSWFKWMKTLGCRQDPWRNWVRGPLSKLAALNEKMYSANCVKLTPSDLPSAFADNHVITEPLAFAAMADIERFYKVCGVTPEIIEQILTGDLQPSPHVLVEILRARQLAEAAKVPDIVEMVNEAVAEGFSVVVFVNFKDTVASLHASIPNSGVVQGGQSAAVREAYVQKFQDDEIHVMICNSAAGGTGVSLHDVRGERPRLSLISPSFNDKEYVQVLGRIHRAGAKSPATQRILVTEKSIEQKVLQILEEKRKSLETLHAQPETRNTDD
jgi:superfamily II DNA or RNA helicase